MAKVVERILPHVALLVSLFMQYTNLPNFLQIIRIYLLLNNYKVFGQFQGLTGEVSPFFFFWIIVFFLNVTLSPKYSSSCRNFQKNESLSCWLSKNLYQTQNYNINTSQRIIYVHFCLTIKVFLRLCYSCSQIKSGLFLEIFFNFSNN